ncbi:MAG: flavin reductase family protein [Pirellulales bacterium]|nr:flavin reductase family protein [Pirellulales bacterium]
MQLDPQELSVRQTYAWMIHLITPRPIAWVSSVSAGGIVNLAPFSFFNGVGANPPTIMFCPANRRDGRPKDTLVNIEQTGQFVVNLVTDAVVEAMNLTAGEYEPDVDEFEVASLKAEPSARVSPPRVAACSAALECELVQTIHVGTGPGGANMVIGRIVWIHVDDQVIRDGKIDAQLFRTVGRMGGAGYVRTTDQFELPRPK